MVSHAKLTLVCLGISIAVSSSDGWKHEQMSKVNWKSKRAATTTYYVNLLLYIDYEIYNRFYKRTTGSTESDRAANTDTEIKKYYTLYAQSMNSIYSGIDSSRLQIKISLVDILISKVRETWISLRPDGDLATGTVLDRFHSQLKDRKYGHAMLITGHNIISSTNEMLAGRAVFKSICQMNKKSVSVVVDQGRYRSVRTACHELAHSLGVEHDTGKPGCLNSDQYIMTGNTSDINSNNILNQWIFSPCSVKDMEDTIGFIMSLSQTEQECLTEKQASNINQPSVENLQPGQVYTPDQQCQMILGSNAYFVRDESYGANICTNMKCRIGNQYVKYTAAEGTSCGSKKWCQLGRCVSTEEAPSKPEKCVFGDRPAQFKRSIQIRSSDGSTKELNMTCSETVRYLPWLCYLNDIASECCSSCGQIATSNLGCEYGDKIQSCLSSSCDDVYPDGYVPASVCCGTCNLKSPFVCQDQDNMCSSDVAGGAARCYDFKFAYRCCKACERARDRNRTNCEYGDRDGQCGILTQGGTKNCDVSYNKQQCCESCNQDVTSSGQIPILAYSSWLMLVMLVVFYKSHAEFKCT